MSEQEEKQFDEKCCESYAKGGFLTTDLENDWALDKHPMKDWINSLLKKREEDLVEKIKESKLLDNPIGPLYGAGWNGCLSHILALIQSK